MEIYKLPYLPLDIFPTMQFRASQAVFWLLTNKKEPKLSKTLSTSQCPSRQDLYKAPREAADIGKCDHKASKALYGKIPNPPPPPPPPPTLHPICITTMTKRDTVDKLWHMFLNISSKT